jgi:prophage DNA circulation protein
VAEPLWKLTNLRPSSFRGVPFKIETAQRGGGRRNVTFEFPKRDVPYTEDMGRMARRFSVAGYIIGPDYPPIRDALIRALETEGPGTLVHYTYGTFRVNAGPYTAVETKQEGGLVRFDMAFVEAGSNPAQRTTEASNSALDQNADNAARSSAATADQKAAQAQSAPGGP